MNIDMQKLLIYTKEELATYILKYSFFDKNIEENMHYIHCQLLLEKDKELTNKEYEKEMELLHQVQEMPSKTLEEQAKRMKLYEKLKKLINKNTTAYKERQKEIDNNHRSEK